MKEGANTNINLNLHAYVNMCIQGKQYASSQWDGYQLKCSAEIFRIDDIYVGNGIIYEENKWLIQNISLIADKKLKYVNDRVLN